MDKNMKSAHISGWYTLLGALIGAVVGAIATGIVNNYSYDYLEHNYTQLEENYNQLLKEHQELEESYHLIQSNYNKVEDEYNKLLLKNDELQEQADQLKAGTFKGPLENPHFFTTSLWNMPLSGDGDLFPDEELEDNFGNAYPYGFRIDVKAGKSKLNTDVMCQVKHTTIKGTIALFNESAEIEDGIWMEIYDGNKLLAETDHLYSGRVPINFEYDIRDVDLLRVVFAGSQDGSIIVDGPYLVKW